MSPAVTTPGPCFFTTMRLGPPPCILLGMSLMFSTMSVTSSRTPAIEENSCSTPSISTDCTAAPCNDDNKMRRNALPSVWPKPRSSGSATRVAKRFESEPGVTWSLFGRISSCQFFWIVTVSPMGQSILPSNHWRWRSRISPRHMHFNVIKIIAGGRAARGRKSNPPALARTATIVRDRRHVADRCDGEARGLQRTERRFAARTGTGNFNLKRAHAVLLRLLGDVFRRDLRGIGGRFARPLETHRSRRRPGNGVALRVGNGDGRVVERRIHVRDAGRNVLALAAAYAGGFLAHSKNLSNDLNAAVMPAATPKNGVANGE